MKTTKRIISTILVVVMCLTIAPLNGFMEIKWEGSDFPEFDFSEIFTPEAKAATSGYYTYSVTDGKAGITDVNTSISGAVTIPSTLGGYSVTSIGKSAFYYCKSLTSVTIPDSVTSIGDSAFYSCTSLTRVSIPDSVTSIGNSAFYYCKSLTSVTIPDSVTSIGNSAFYSCTSLTNVTIPDSVTSIGNSAFYDCDNLTRVSIPDSVTSIGDYAFGFCDNLTSVTIPDSVTSIGDYAFGSCDNLTRVSIPDSVTSIGDYAFCYCDSLISITVAAGNEHYCSVDGVLFNKNKTTLIQYPAGNYNTYYYIPDSVTSIGDSAFHDCGLTSVTIGNSVTSIGDSAFYNCNSLKSVTIGNSVTSIGDYAFRYCTRLTNVTIPDSVTSIGYSAFHGCDNLKSVTVAAGNEHYCSVDGVLFNKNKTTLIQYPAGNDKSSYYIPDSVTSIGDYAFDGCDSLKSVTIGNSVTSIGNQAFRDCTSFHSVSIPDSVTSIGDAAFYSCTSLTRVSIGNSVTSIGNYAFYYCDSLTDVYFSGTKGVSIGQGNEKLHFVTIHYNHKHSYGTSVTTPTCTEEGYITYYCECSDFYTEKIDIDTNAHKWNSGVITTTASCKTSGIMTYTCQYNSSHKETENLGINASNHINTKNVAEVKATCSAKGYTAGVYCNDCQKYISGYTEIPVDTNAHKWNNGAITTTATCTVRGVKTYTCQNNSSHKKTENLGVNASNHVNTKIVPETPATFETVGYTAGVYCNDCKKYISGHTEIPKLVPVFTDSKNAKVNGNDILSNNGLTAAQLLSQAGKGAVIMTSDGKAVENTSLIGTGMILTMADGSKKEIVVYGDVDGNGKITAADARKALRASVSLEKYKETSAQYKAANVESKNKISASDARLILRASVGLEDAKKWMK